MECGKLFLKIPILLIGCIPFCDQFEVSCTVKMLRTIIALIVLEILHLSGASAQCGIVMHPLSQNVSVGDTVNLQCLTESDASVTNWLFERDGTSTTVDRGDMINGALTINNFDSSYAGSYRCVVDNRCVSRAANLYFTDTTKTTFKMNPQDFVAFEGIGTAAFNCTYDDSEYLIPPTIFWELNETMLSQDDNAIVIFSYRYTSFLQIHQPTSSIHMGSITCLVRSESGDVRSQAASLSIMSGDPPSDQPSFSTVPVPLMYLNKGDTVIAGCSSDIAIDSIPIAWAFENNTEFLFTGFNIPLFDIPLSLYGHTNLLLNSTEFDYHDKTYLCQLLWRSGNVFFNAPVTFFVYDSPDISIGVPADSVLTRESGEQVTFSVGVNKNTPAMVKWFFNGESLTSSTDRRVEIVNDQNDDFDFRKVWTQDLDTSLHINNITCDDIGFYQVEISNPVETIFMTYYLIVENCNAVIEGPSNVTYIPGLTPLPIELICNVTGIPAWRVNGTTYALTELTNGELPGHSRAVTNILINSPVNNTEYICVSQINDDEMTSDPAYIIIVGTAVIEGPSNVTYIPGLTSLPIELTCNVTGTPAWRVNGTTYALTELTNGELPGHNRTVTNILINSPVNNTEYICVSQTNYDEMTSDPAYIIIDDTEITPMQIQVSADDGDSFPWYIILILVLLLLLLLLLLVLCCWCWRRRYVVYEAEKLESKYHKEYEVMRRGDATL